MTMNTIFPIDGYPQQRYDATRAAFERLIDRNWGSDPLRDPGRGLPRPKLILETFAGMGGQTRILAGAFPGATHMGWEKDKACYDKLSLVHAMDCDRFEASEIFCKEFPLETFDCFMEGWKSNHPTDPVLLVVDGAFSLAQFDHYEPYHHPDADYLIICEQARTRLHLHRKTYGLSKDLNGMELYHQYLQKVAERHRRPMIDIEVTKYSPAYLLLGPVQE